MNFFRSFRAALTIGGSVILFSVLPLNSASAALSQVGYRWFSYANSTDVGPPLARQNFPATEIFSRMPARLRMLLKTDVNAPLNSLNLKLQFAERSGTCDTAFSGENYADVDKNSGFIRFSDNPRPSDGLPLIANPRDPVNGADTIQNQSYEEENNFLNAQSRIGPAQIGKWDFSLVNAFAPSGNTYCFRVVNSDNSLISSYVEIPELETSGDNEGGERVGGTPENFFAPTARGGLLSQWTSPLNAMRSDDQYTTAALTLLGQDYAFFGFSVPVGNEITGIEVKIESSSILALSSIDVQLSPDAGTIFTSAKNTGNLTTSDIEYTLGGPEDNWGRTWSAEEFSDANFLLRVSSVLGTADTLKLDRIIVRVHNQAVGGSGGGGGRAFPPETYREIFFGFWKRLISIFIQIR
ncbi:hypothetical protein HYT01_03145 [Candidatus Giovannonibacteria bacterium]|nr:hypothetical protein [Candidatus Giovannonibacteria bacterium]